MKAIKSEVFDVEFMQKEGQTHFCVCDGGHCDRSDRGVCETRRKQSLRVTDKRG